MSGKSPRSNTLDRLQRFSFSRGAAKKECACAPESGDAARSAFTSSQRPAREKAERLRELTEKLKGCSPVPRRPTHSSPVTSFKSVSFSQVDFTAVDGKHPRRKSLSEENTGKVGDDSVAVDNRSLTHPLGGRRPRVKPRRVAVEGASPVKEIPIPSVVDEMNNALSEQPPRSRNSGGGGSQADKSRKRKGIYITKWPTSIDSSQEMQDAIPTIYLQAGESCWDGLQEDAACNGLDKPQATPPPTSNLLVRVDSLSESESEQNRDGLASSRPSIYSDKSDLSDCETQSNSPRRYSKRPLRGPYGQMLEAEMKRPETNNMFSKLYYNKELKFLDDLMGSITADNNKPSNLPPAQGSPPQSGIARTRSAGNRSLDETHMPKTPPQRKTGATALNSPLVRHQRTTSSPSKLEGIVIAPDPTLKTSSEYLSAQTFLENLSNTNGTRTHIVIELYDTEQSYVESLQTLVTKYLQPLKKPENAGLLEPSIVDEIFYQVPALLAHHEIFLEELHKRLDHWDIKQKIGDVFIDVFTKPSVVETYTAFVNNWKKAKENIKSTKQAKPAFARFLEAMAREHKGKLQLDSLLIKPIQKFPKYEMLIQRLIKHTEPSHPDYQLLVEAQAHIHDLLLKINCSEFDQNQQTLKELECLIEGVVNLIASERQFLRHDPVVMMATQGARKDRALFLFSDLLLVTSIKRRSGTLRKPSALCPTLETHKYKLLMRLPLDDLEVVKPKDDNVRRVLSEMETLSEDLATLTQIGELAATLHCSHDVLDETLRELLAAANRQLVERQSSGSQVAGLELSFNTS